MTGLEMKVFEWTKVLFRNASSWVSHASAVVALLARRCRMKLAKEGREWANTRFAITEIVSSVGVYLVLASFSQLPAAVRFRG
jgi:hypothetical protein